MVTLAEVELVWPGVIAAIKDPKTKRCEIVLEPSELFPTKVFCFGCPVGTWCRVDGTNNEVRGYGVLGTRESNKSRLGSPIVFSAPYPKNDDFDAIMAKILDEFAKYLSQRETSQESKLNKILCKFAKREISPERKQEQCEDGPSILRTLETWKRYPVIGQWQKMKWDPVSLTNLVNLAVEEVIPKDATTTQIPIPTISSNTEPVAAAAEPGNDWSDTEESDGGEEETTSSSEDEGIVQRKRKKVAVLAPVPPPPIAPSLARVLLKELTALEACADTEKTEYQIKSLKRPKKPKKRQHALEQNEEIKKTKEITRPKKYATGNKRPAEQYVEDDEKTEPNNDEDEPITKKSRTTKADLYKYDLDFCCSDAGFRYKDTQIRKIFYYRKMCLAEFEKTPTRMIVDQDRISRFERGSRGAQPNFKVATTQEFQKIWVGIKLQKIGSSFFCRVCVC